MSNNHRQKCGMSRKLLKGWELEGREKRMLRVKRKTPSNIQRSRIIFHSLS